MIVIEAYLEIILKNLIINQKKKQLQYLQTSISHFSPTVQYNRYSPESSDVQFKKQSFLKL